MIDVIFFVFPTVSWMQHFSGSSAHRSAPEAAAHWHTDILNTRTALLPSSSEGKRTLTTTVTFCLTSTEINRFEKVRELGSCSSSIRLWIKASWSALETNGRCWLCSFFSGLNASLHLCSKVSGAHYKLLQHSSPTHLPCVRSPHAARARAPKSTSKAPSDTFRRVCFFCKCPRPHLCAATADRAAAAALTRPSPDTTGHTVK